jgi:hypothetical protein
MAAPLIAPKTNDLWSDFCGQIFWKLVKVTEEWLHYDDNWMNQKEVNE